jgi:hypothetical protein
MTTAPMEDMGSFGVPVELDRRRERARTGEGMFRLTYTPCPSMDAAESCEIAVRCADNLRALLYVTTLFLS